jgi:glycosyltransferase involved in cell wall biosynthesis
VENASAFAQQHDMLVVPLLRGAGIRVKIVESFSLGIPVISTTMGVQGLEINNHDSLIQAEPQDLADAIIAVLNSPDRLDQLSEAGLKAARTCFDQNKIGAELLEFYGQHVRI